MDENDPTSSEETESGWDFQRLKDEIRLKIHLGKMDAKDAWAKLEPKVTDFEQKMEKTEDDVGAEFRKMGKILKEELEHLRDRLNEE